MADVESTSRAPEWASRALAAEFAPVPRIGVLQAARRYWYLILLPLVVFVALGIVAGEKRTPKYTAQVRLMVGRLNISTPGAVAGFAQAAQDLASAYPLVINATGVVDPLAKQFHTTPAGIRSAVTSTQVPSSPIVEVLATGSSPRYVMKLANAASNQLVTYLTNFNRDNPDQQRLLKAEQGAQRTFQHDLARLQDISKLKKPLSPDNQRLAAQVAVDKIQTDGYASDYQLTLQTQAVTSLLQPIQFADTATSDKTSKLEITVFAGLLVGLLVGLGLATLRANAVARRALTAPQWEPEVRKSDSGSGPGLTAEHAAENGTSDTEDPKPRPPDA